jgi:uncharacterized protein (TIGR02246 family)
MAGPLIAKKGGRDMAFIGALADRIAIRERIDAYSDAVTCHDPESWLACWAEDGVWCLPTAEHRGRAALRLAWASMLGPVREMIFLAEVGHIAVDGDRAHARCIVREVVLRADGTIRKYAARYTDVLVRARGDWLFARRDYRLLVFEQIEATSPA